MVACAYNPSNFKAEIGRTQIQGQSGQLGEILSQKKKNKELEI